jgi:DNA-binding response OmpR family regulator
MPDAKKRVLIVDDDPWTRKALASNFSHRGWEALSAATLAEGLHLLQTRPTCIILDLSLPEGCGEALLREVRESGLPARIVVCTVILDPNRLAGVRTLRPDGLFQKPIDVEEVLNACGTPSKGR